MLFLATLLFTGGCGNRRVDIHRAETFQRFPLYWVGMHFGRWDLEAVDGLDYDSPIISFVYGECTPRGGDEPSCVPPFQIQVSRSCGGPPKALGEIRGAPVGTIDGAPVLFTRGAQVKVYRGEGSYPGLPLKVLRALRSINDVQPVIRATGPIPPPSENACRP